MTEKIKANLESKFIIFIIKQLNKTKRIKKTIARDK